MNPNDPTLPDSAAPSLVPEETAPQSAPQPAAQPGPAPDAPAPEMTVKACAAKLRELFPALFGGRPKPLKLRIQQDINQRCPGLFPKPVLSAFLRRHTMTDAYLQAVSTQTQRFDLDGQPAGELSAEHRQLATETLKQRRAREDEKHAAERAAEAERQGRAALLAAFETTTLTRENFCALKGVDPAQLDALLAQATEERKQRQQFLAELLQAFRASGQNVPSFAAARRMHPAQLDRLLREASGESGARRPDERRENRPHGSGRRDERDSRPRRPREGTGRPRPGPGGRPGRD